MNKKVIVFSLISISIFLTGCKGQMNFQAGDSSANISAPMEEKIISNAETPQADKIEIIDFHGIRRCFSCQTIEKFAKETIEEFFQPEMRDGIITFQSINVEDSQNQAIVQKYHARGSSLFINVIKDGKDNIEEDIRVWRLIGDEKKFKEYLKNKLENYLK